MNLWTVHKSEFDLYKYIFHVLLICHYKLTLPHELADS